MKNNDTYDVAYLEWLTNKTAGTMALEYYKEHNMTEANVMTNEEFYRDTATVLMAAYNEDPSTADEKGLALVNARFEDSAERKFAIDQIAAIVAKEFQDAVDAQEAPSEVEEAADAAE